MSKLSKSRPNQFTALAVLCLIVGFLLTIDNMGILTGTWKLWPIFSLLLGLGGIWTFRAESKKELIVLGMGTYLIGISIFFFILNFTSWSAMSKWWPTFIGIFGISLLVVSYFAENKRWFAMSGLFFIFLSLTFFMVFTLEAKLWPISLMLFGIWILIIPRRNQSEKRSCNN